MNFDTGRKRKLSRMKRAEALIDGKWAREGEMVSLLEALIEPGDRVCIEGNNQKQALFLAKSLAKVNPAKVNNLHMVQSAVSLPEHVTVFERGIANKLDFCYSSSQGTRLMQSIFKK